jgi:hypothetical protein
MGSLLLRAMSIDLFGQLANFVAQLGREAGVCSGERKSFETAILRWRVFSLARGPWTPAIHLKLLPRR